MQSPSARRGQPDLSSRSTADIEGLRESLDEAQAVIFARLQAYAQEVCQCMRSVGPPAGLARTILPP